MAKLSEELWNTLMGLAEDEFKKFKWFLKQDDILEGFPGIPVARLEKADMQDTVDLMVQKYQGPGAVTVFFTVLEKISRNDLVHSLSKTQKGKLTKRRDMHLNLYNNYGLITFKQFHKS